MKALLVILSLFLAACVKSVVPLPSSTAISANAPLLGDWVLESESDAVSLRIETEGDHLGLVQKELKSDGSLKTERYSATQTTFKGNDYLSIFVTNDKNPRYFICKFHVSKDGKLRFWPPDVKFVSKAIRSGRLAGTTRPDKLIPEASLSASPEALLRFLSRNDRHVFPEVSATFKRGN